MAREQFIDSLRHASRMLPPPGVSAGNGPRSDAHLGAKLHADLWLTPKSVEGYDLADFADWPKGERVQLTKDVDAFLAIARQVPADKPAASSQRKLARKHLEGVIAIARQRLLNEWLEAQQHVIAEATAAARGQGWYVDQDEKEVVESLLGTYKAPRLRIRTRNHEVILDPIARFGSGRQGVVDLVVLPKFETAYLVTFKEGNWHIVSPQGTQHKRPFSQATLVNTITKLSHN